MSNKRLLPLLTHLARPSPLSSFLPAIRPSPRLPHAHHHQPLPPHTHHPYSTTPPKEPKSYTFEEIQTLSTTQPPSTLLIDVREPSELRATGRIPGAVNLPLTSHPDAFWLAEADFLERFGFRRPGSSSAAPGSSSVSATEAADKEGGKEQDVTEVVFYCKAGVRSRAAARLARGWEGEGVRVGEYKGSWVEWVGRGGVVEQ